MAAKLAVWMVVCVSALLAVAWGGRSSHPLDAFPEEIILHAPFSAFVNNSGKIIADPSAAWHTSTFVSCACVRDCVAVTLTLNTEVIPALAAQAKAYGVNTIWSCGSMGQFDTMTLNERILFNQAWIAAAHDQGTTTNTPLYRERLVRFALS
jgi:hypothetical protein